jgi:isoleucyl-tRNA synthetase
MGLFREWSINMHDWLVYWADQARSWFLGNLVHARMILEQYPYDQRPISLLGA